VNSPTYINKTDHRDGSPMKSQWLIKESEETDCFRNAYSEGWSDNSDDKNVYWGLFFETIEATKIVAYLGTTARNEPRQFRLFVAKFVNDSRNDQWHGYPADGVHHNPQDIPPQKVLRTWLTARLLPPAKISKLAKGRQCSL